MENTQSDLLKLDAEIRMTEHKIMVKKEIQKRLQKIRTTESQQNVSLLAGESHRKTFVIPSTSQEPSTLSFPARIPRKTYFTPWSQIECPARIPRKTYFTTWSQIAESLEFNESSETASSELTSSVIPTSPTAAEQVAEDWPKGLRSSSEISRKTFVVPSGVLPAKPELPWGSRPSNRIAQQTFVVPPPLGADQEAKLISPDRPNESSYLHLNTRRPSFSSLRALIDDEPTTGGPSGINSCEQIAEKTLCIPSSPLAAKPKLCNQTGELSSHQLVSRKTFVIPSSATVQPVSGADPVCPDSSELTQKTSPLPVTAVDKDEGGTRNHKSSTQINTSHELQKNSSPLSETHCMEGNSPDISSSEGTEKCHRKTGTKYRPYNLRSSCHRKTGTKYSPYNLRSSCVGCYNHSVISPDIYGNKEHLCSGLKQTAVISLPTQVEEEPQNTGDDKNNVLETTSSSCQCEAQAMTPPCGDVEHVLNRTYVTPSPTQHPYELPNIDAPETETSVSETFFTPTQFPIADPNSTFVTACEEFYTPPELNVTFEGENPTQDLNRTFVIPAPLLAVSESEGTKLRTLQTVTSFAHKPSVELDKTFINPPPDVLEPLHAISEHNIGCDRDLNYTFVVPVLEKVVSEKTASTIKKRIIPLVPRSQSRALADRNKLASGTPVIKGTVDIPKNTPVSLDIKININKDNKPIYKPNLPPQLIKMGTMAPKQCNKPVARPPITYRCAAGVVRTELSRERTRLARSHPYRRPEVHNVGARGPLRSRLAAEEACSSKALRL